ncbi:hypothetical protein [Nocardioides bizhenqiangii]|uniref:Restriction endonuclease n=1 Tax=Nocardioides bizhenqiangii TaxID=3095076 RepID=A0ABZ0ZSN6_9ACTN|nr:hypothetical protein [Nocardioides sp. HM61]WQQ27275.1 hypothetical protein SHK19_03380 [Nocardioides sp. HM61]
MAGIAEQLFEVHVERAHGAPGVERLQAVLATVKRIYRVRSPQSFPEGLVVVASIAPGGVLDPSVSSQLDTAYKLNSLSAGAVVEVMADGTARGRPLGSDDINAMALSAVVYWYSNASGDGTEAIVLPDGHVSVPNPNGYPSAIASPTFWELEDSLSWYHERLASKGTCKILKTVWADDGQGRRLAFVNHPEIIMRESLAQHLRSSLRDHQAIRVNEEQNQSETEPVDIEVTWSLTTHIALLEVKWVGKCLEETNTRLASYSYADSRAREGVPQLSGYLDDAYERNPGHEVKGYLVVFDGRRRGISRWQPGAVSGNDAWYYENREIDYRGTIPVRDDFRPPVRLFLEPRLPRPTAS